MGEKRWNNGEKKGENGVKTLKKKPWHANMPELNMFDPVHISQIRDEKHKT